MKKLFSAAVMVCLAVIFVAGTVMAFDAPGGAQYGVTTDGVYFISADLVKAANGSAPKAMVAPSFKPEATKLNGIYYIYVSGNRAFGGQDFCFDIGNNKFLPHALINDARIKAADATDNGVGGYNFRMSPK